MSAEIRERQEARRELLLDRLDATSVYQRKWHREHYYRMRGESYRQALNEELAINERRQSEYDQIRATSDGELAALIEEQERDRIYGDRIKRPRILSSLDTYYARGEKNLGLHEKLSAPEEEAA